MHSSLTIWFAILSSLWIIPLRTSGQAAAEFDVVLHGGSYQQLTSGCFIPNRFTSSCSCPSTFTPSCYDAVIYNNTKADVSNTVTYSTSSRIFINSRFCLCDRTSGLSATASVFGGAYQQDDDSSCRYKNPHTSSCSCPLGFRSVSLRSLVIRLGTSDSIIGSHILVCLRPSSEKQVGVVTTDNASFLRNSQPTTVRVLNNFHGLYAISANQSTPERCLLENILPNLRSSRYLSSVHSEKCNCPNNACAASFFWLTDQLGYPFSYHRVGVCESSLQQPVSSATLKNKVMYGYQKWQTTPKDGLGLGYFHWVKDGSPVTPSNADSATTFALWPDTTEFPSSNLSTTALSRPDGSPTTLYSAYLPDTVDLHIRWLQYYGLDGMWLQLFFGGSVMGQANLFSVNQLRKSSEAYGRVFGIMWDISARSDNLFQLLQDDVQRFKDNNVFTSHAYVRHQGKPVVAVWGFGVRSAVNVSTATRCIQLLKDSGFAVLGGVYFSWRTQLGGSGENFTSVYNMMDIVAPWAVGVFSSPQHYLSFVPSVQRSDSDYCSQRGIGYSPVILPGFSWNNQQVHEDPSRRLNHIPRLGGVLLQTQADALESSVVRQAAFSHVFVAMFDEFDESTAVAKAAESRLDRPGGFLSLDADGFRVPNDHYLCLASRQTYRLQQPLSIDFPFTFRNATGTS